MNLSKEQRNGLIELINLGLESGARVLNDLVEVPVELQVTNLDQFSGAKLSEAMESSAGKKFLAVGLPYQGKFSGSACLVLPAESVANFVKALTGEDICENDPKRTREITITEVGNIVLNGVMGTIGNKLKHTVTFSVPKYVEGGAELLLNLCGNVKFDDFVLVAKTRFVVKELSLEGDLVLMFDEDSLATLLVGQNDQSVMTAK